MSAQRRHVALVGFMGAGKTTLGAEAAPLLGRAFEDVDAAVERSAGDDIAALFRAQGESAFRAAEEEETLRHLQAGGAPSVLALGGGAVTSPAVRAALAQRAVTVWLDVDVDVAWKRVSGSARPLAQDEGAFRSLYDERQPLYREVADAAAGDVDDIVLAAAGVRIEAGALDRLGELVPGVGPVALVVDRHVAGIHGAQAQLALGGRLASLHELPPGQEAKSLAVAERLWAELPLDRGGTLVALGGGSLTDVAGFVAATHLRGVPWVAVPTTLVGQVDAGIGGKTGLDTEAGKNRVGAFHWPRRTIVDSALLATLPAAERRAGLAEVVKTGLLAGDRLWELPEAELVRRSAAFKAAVCMRDPEEQGERAILNLGHTFAHALEAASGYRLRHGDAVALGLCAALRVSEEHLGLDPSWRALVGDALEPRPVAVDAHAARAALHRDKKVRDGRLRLVLLEAPGVPVVTDEVAAEAAYRALDRLIAVGRP